jgi:hypothetical protein
MRQHVLRRYEIRWPRVAETVALMAVVLALAANAAGAI